LAVVDSRTKNRAAWHTQAAMIEAAFGADEVPQRSSAVVELDRGWFNAVYRVRLRSGRTVVLKIAPDPGVPVLTYERDLMRNEVAAMRVASPRASVPTIEHEDFSGGLLRAPWFFMSYLDGDNLGALIEDSRLAPSSSAALMRELGSINRSINELRGDGFGSVGGARSATWRGVFTRMVCDVLGDAQSIGLDLGPLPDAVHRILDRHGAVLDDVRTPRLVSWDLWPGNAITRHGRIAGVVDHERSLWGDPVMEAAFINADIPIYPEADQFALGYGPADFGESAPLRRQLYSVHRLLVMTVEPHYRGPQDPNQSAWSRQRIAALLDRL
jgi:aminoglycoside phosphotransferase (APT) family kinase protein